MQWFKDRLLTVREAFVVREVLALPIVVTAVTLAAAGFAIVSNYVADWGVYGLLGIPRWAVIAFAAVFLTLVFMIEYANRLRADLVPKIKLSFDAKQSGIALTPVAIKAQDDQERSTGQIIDAIYIRIHAELLSKATLRDCPTFIEKIWRRSADNAPLQEITLHNPISLAEVTVRPRIKSHVDFLFCISSDNRLQIAGAWPLNLRNAFDTAATYRFRLTLIAADVPTSIEVDVCWTGQWDKVTAQQVQD